MTKIYAHRGARAVAPENTLPAFEKALALGADGIELDVHCCASGELVVMHDFGVERTTNGRGKAGELSLAQLRTLDAGASFGDAFQGVQIPTLDDALDLIGDRCEVNVEIKSHDYRGGDEADGVANVIAHRDLYGQVIVSSFNPVTLLKMRHLDARIRLGLLYAVPLPEYLFDAWLSPLMAPEALHPHFNIVDEAFMLRARTLGKSVNVWTVNDVTEAQRLAALGVDAIITDTPDVIRIGLGGREG